MNALSSSDLEFYGALALVGVAVALVIWSVIRQLESVGREKAELLGAVDRGPNTIYHFIGRSALLQVQIVWAVLAGGGLFAILMSLKAGSPLVWCAVSAAAAALAWFLPRFHYRRKAKARAELFANQMLDFSLGLTNGLKAGQALAQALESFSHNCEDPMREELAVLLREHRLGVELSDAMERMHGRIPCEDLQLLSVAIRLTVKSGGSLAEVVEKITALIRSRIDFRRRLAALTAQGRFEALAMSLAPLAAFGLLFLADRDLMVPMVTTGTGWAAIAGVALLETVGYFVIRKITDIQV